MRARNRLRSWIAISRLCPRSLSDRRRHSVSPVITPRYFATYMEVVGWLAHSQWNRVEGHDGRQGRPKGINFSTGPRLEAESIVDDNTIKQRRPVARICWGRAVVGDGRCDLVGVRPCPSEARSLPSSGLVSNRKESGEVDGRVPELHAGVALDAVKRLQSFFDDAVAAVVGDDVGDRQRCWR